MVGVRSVDGGGGSPICSRQLRHSIRLLSKPHSMYYREKSRKIDRLTGAFCATSKSTSAQSTGAPAAWMIAMLVRPPLAEHHWIDTVGSVAWPSPRRCARALQDAK